MASKKQNFTTGTASFFNAPTISDAESITDASDAKKIAANGRYNFNLKMPLDWKDRLADQAWMRRMTISDMLNMVIGEWLDSQERK